MRVHKTRTDIEKETGRKFIDICKELREEGLSPSEIARKLNLSSPNVVTGAFYNEKIEKKREISTATLTDLFGGKKQAFEKKFTEQMKMHPKDFFYQKYIAEQLSIMDIALMFGVSSKTIGRYLKYFNISKSMAQSRQDAISKGKIDYEKIVRKARRTTKKTRFVYDNTNPQVMACEIFKEKFESLLAHYNLSDIEVVVGYNEWGILKSKEVDIPIIIINTNKNTFSKYAIEYNGEIWHSDEHRDKNKQEYLTLKGWGYYTILDSNGSLIKIRNQIDKIVKDIIKKII